MPRSCTICWHEKRPAIERWLYAGRRPSEAARKFKVGDDAVRRHRNNHMPALVKDPEERRVQMSAQVLSEGQALYEHVLDLLRRSEAEGDHRVSLAALRELRHSIELFIKLLGKPREPGPPSLLLAPEWPALRSVLLDALDPYPDVRLAVAEKLARLTADEGNGHG